MLARYKQDRKKGTEMDNGRTRKSKSGEKKSSAKKLSEQQRKKSKVLKERWQQKGGNDESKVDSSIRFEKVESNIPKPLFLPTESLNLSDRPIRAAAATAQAISEAQQQFLDLEPPPEFKRNKHGQIEVLVDKPIRTRKYCKRVKTLTPDETNASKEQKIELTEEMIMNNVDDLVTSFKNQYMDMVHTLQEPSYINNIQYQLRVEKSKNDLLAKRVDQLQMQVNVLIQESLEMLKESLKELGIDVLKPVEFIQKAKEIVGKHNDLRKMKQFLEDEVNNLEEEQKTLIYEKEKQLLEHSYDIPDEELMQAVQNTISRCLLKHQQLLDNRDYTLTRVKEAINDTNNNNNNENESVNNCNFNRQDDNKNLQSFASQGQQHIPDIIPPLMSSVSRMAMIIEESVRESVPQPQKSIYSMESQTHSKHKRKEKTKDKSGHCQDEAAEGLALQFENYASSKMDNTKSEGSYSGDENHWQREISSGFDRLVALASEVDTRRSVADADHVQRAGEKLPNRHFKRKYFDQEYLRSKMQKM